LIDRFRRGHAPILPFQGVSLGVFPMRFAHPPRTVAIDLELNGREFRMKRSRRNHVAALAAVLCVLAMGASASQASAANGFSIGVAGPSTASVGQSVILKVSGKNPTPGYPDYYWFGTWLSVNVIPTSIASSCPPTADEGYQLGSAGYAQGGGYLVFTQREPVDSNGNWSVTVGYTPQVASRVLICAYSDDGYTNTLAVGQHAMEITGPGSTTTAKKSCKKKRRKCKRRRK